MKSFAAFLALSITAGFAAAAEPDIALEPAHIIVNPWRFHISPTKRQGVPGIERTAKGRLWVIHGRDVESPRNYQVLIRSDSNGRRWSHPKLMILPREGVRAMSAAIWIDPTGRMWALWGQSFGQQDGRYGIWAITTDHPDGVQAPDGTIYIVYDHNRTPDGEVLMATFTEDDVRAGKPVSDKVSLRGEVARLPIEWLED